MRRLVASFIPIQFRLKERDLSDAFHENPKFRHEVEAVYHDLSRLISIASGRPAPTEGRPGGRPLQNRRLLSILGCVYPKF